MFNGMKYGRVTGQAVADAAPLFVRVVDKLIEAEDLPLPHTAADRLIGLVNRDTAAHLLGAWVYYYFPDENDYDLPANTHVIVLGSDD